MKQRVEDMKGTPSKGTASKTTTPLKGKAAAAAAAPRDVPTVETCRWMKRTHELNECAHEWDNERTSDWLIDWRLTVIDWLLNVGTMMHVHDECQMNVRRMSCACHLYVSVIYYVFNMCSHVHNEMPYAFLMNVMWMSAACQMDVMCI